MRPGIAEKTNPRNGAFVCRLHYSADVNKRLAGWKTAAKQSMTERNWRREYEIDWATPEGEPVIPEYDASVHAAPCVVDRNLPLLRGWDFGFVSPVCLFAQYATFGQLRFLRELAPFNTPLRSLLPMVAGITTELVGFNAAGVFDAGDPNVHNQTELGSTAEVLAEYRIRMHSTRPGSQVSYANFRERFTSMPFVQGMGHIPAVLVDPTGCPNLHEALSGAFHLLGNPGDTTKSQTHIPIKCHPYKDLVDAARYLHDCLSLASRGVTDAMVDMATRDIPKDFRPTPTISGDWWVTPAWNES